MMSIYWRVTSPPKHRVIKITNLYLFLENDKNKIRNRHYYDITPFLLGL